MTREMTEEQKETRIFLESLSVTQMRRLLNGPEVFGSTVIEHAVESGKVSVLIDQVLDQEYSEMTPEQQERVRNLADKVHSKFVA